MRYVRTFWAIVTLILIGSGHRSVQAQLGFANATTYPVAGNPYGVVVADFNGDGIQDIAAAHPQQNAISILLGTGNGTFAPVSVLDTNRPGLSGLSGQRGITSGDFNGDGKPDIAVSEFATNSVSVYFGNGDGSFQYDATYFIPTGNSTYGTGPNELRVGDMNGDGIPDIVTANYNDYASQYPRLGSVGLLLGTGGGQFQFSTNIPTGSLASAADQGGGGPAKLALGDLNADGMTDIVTADFHASTPTGDTGHYISVLLRQAGGSYQRTNYDLGEGAQPNGVAIGDLNDDGLPDVVAGSNRQTSLRVFFNSGGGVFTALPLLLDIGATSEHVVVRDFNGDGKLDILADTANYAAVVQSHGDGTFHAPLLVSNPGSGSWIAAGDFNQDGKADFVASLYSSENLGVFLNTSVPPSPLPAGLLISSFYTNNVLRFRDPETGGIFYDTFIPAGEGGLSKPSGIAIGPNGHLYVGNSTTYQIHEYDGQTGAFVRVFAETGYYSNQYPGLLQGGYCAGLTWGPDGNLYVVREYFGGGFGAQSAVLRFDGQTGAPLPSPGRTGADFLNIDTGLLRARTVAFDEDHNLYVTNLRHHESLPQVVIFQGPYGAAPGTYLDLIDLRLPGLNPSLIFPHDMKVGSDGKFYISTGGANAILRYDPDLHVLDIYAQGGGMNNVLGLAFGPDGSLYAGSDYDANNQSISSVQRFQGPLGSSPGAFLDTFINPGMGGLSNPVWMVFQTPIDTTPPPTICSVLPLPNAAGWNNTDPTVSLTATDNPGGSGVASISYRYRINGGSWSSWVTVPGCSVALPTFTQEGATLVEHYATDNAGNSGSIESCPVHLDKTPPQTISKMRGVSGNIQVTLCATDALSGVAQTFYILDQDDEQTYTGPFPVPASGNHTITYWSVDVAGNVEMPITRPVVPTVVIHLQDSAGNPLAGGMAQYYYAGSWRDIGVTGADGTVSIELPAATYTFSMDYLGGRIQKSQNVALGSDVVFQTTRAVVHLKDSAGNPLAGGKAQYYAGAWRDIGTTGADGTTSMELLPKTYTFSMDYLGGRIQKNQNIATDPNVVFQTTRVVISLKDSTGSPLSGGMAQYYAGSWRDIGLTGSDGTVSIELLPKTYTFSMDYRGGRTQKNQDIATDPQVVFQTARATVHLRDSAGNPLAGGMAQYYAGSWKDIGLTGSDGTVSIELLPKTYTFSMDYLGARVQKSQDIASDFNVIFQTTRVHSVSGTCIQYYASGWKTFLNDMELLPVTYTFRFNDATPNTSVAISGIVTNIH